MRFLMSWLRARSRRPAAPRRPTAFRPRLECLEDRVTPSGGIGGGGPGGTVPVYYLPPGSVVPQQVPTPSPTHGHGGADVVQVKT